MDWYEVVKTINGRRYRYRQRTWRDAATGRMRTASEYLGPDRRQLAPPEPLPPPQPLPTNWQPVPLLLPKQRHALVKEAGLTGERSRLVSAVLDAAIAAPLSLVSAATRPRSFAQMQRLKSPSPKFKPDARILALPKALRLGVTTRPALPFRLSKRQQNTGLFDGAYYTPARDAIQIPDPARYASQPGCSAEHKYHLVFLHELAHATKGPGRAGRSTTSYNPHSYAEEEVVAETAAFLVAQHLGLAPATAAYSAAYVQHYLNQLGRRPDFAIAAPRALRHASEAADYLLAKIAEL